MNGRLFTIKKTTWINLSFTISVLIATIGGLLSFFYFNKEYYFFYIFCLCTGMHLILKSFLFRLDSACFLGILLMLIGFFFFYVNYWEIFNYFGIFVLLAFSAASLFVYYFFNQKFHMVISLSLFFVAVIYLFVLRNLLLF